MRQIIKQPDGRYAVYSTIVDAFIQMDATQHDLIQFFREEAAEDAEKSCNLQIEAADAGKVGQFGLTWEEAMENHEKTTRANADQLDREP